VLAQFRHEYLGVRVMVKGAPLFAGQDRSAG